MGKHTAPRMGTELAAPPGSTAARSTPYRDRAEAAGIDVDRVEHVSSTAEIDLRPRTVYAVSGRLERDGDITGRAEHVAIVGLGDGVLPVPHGNRGYDIGVRGGPFLLSGMTIDQTAGGGAWGRIAAPGDGMQLVDVEWRGSGKPANPDPSEPIGQKSGPGVSMPATSESATNVQRNVTNVHRGVLADIHFGDRPIGQWLGSKHKGTLRMVNCEYSAWANNALYASASPGRFEIEGGVYRDNGVSALRIAHGKMEDVVVEHDASRGLLGNANARGHASVGVAAEQKKDGANGKPGPDLINVTVRMKDVSKGGAAARAYDIHGKAEWGKIIGCDLHVERKAGDYAADIEIRGGVKAIRDLTVSGSNPRHHSIDNRSGERVVIDGFERDYPHSRKRDKGAPVDWR